MKVDETQLRRVQLLALHRAGLDIADDGAQLVQSRLEPRVRALGLTELSAYLDRVEADTAGELQQFVSALSTHVTSFFREQHHFAELFAYTQAHCRAQRGPIRPLRIWSAACSTGEELYSALVTVCNAGIPPQAGHLELFGSDVSDAQLSQAKRGIYNEQMLSSIERAQVSEYFLRGTGRFSGNLRVKPEYTRLIQWQRLNLAEPWPWKQGFDVIFCRNVLFYFQGSDIDQVCERLANTLRPGGLLFLGHAESRDLSSFGLKAVGPTTYKKVVLSDQHHHPQEKVAA